MESHKLFNISIRIKFTITELWSLSNVGGEEEDKGK